MRQQGRPDRSGSAGQKTEPSSRAVDPRAVEQIGSKLNRSDERASLYPGRGYEAPMAGKTNHGNCGSQGKH
jgi:hypothetical protein